MACYFVYGTQYPCKLRNTLIFLEHFIFGLPSAEKEPYMVQQAANMLCSEVVTRGVHTIDSWKQDASWKKLGEVKKQQTGGIILVANCWFKPHPKYWESIVTKFVLRTLTPLKCVCGRGSTPDFAGGAFTIPYRAVLKGKELIDQFFSKNVGTLLPQDAF